MSESLRVLRITATYPCCGKPARQLPERGRVERRHFCEPDDETGTYWQITTSTREPVPGVTITKADFLDLADTEAYLHYGSRRVPHRSLNRRGTSR
jgi:hypothetical protein